MTILRHCRRLRTLLRDLPIRAIAVLLGVGWLLAGPAAAAPHAHARRPLPTPLRSTAVLATHTAPRKPTSRHKADVPSTGHSAKKGKGRVRRPIVDDAHVPLLRTERRPAANRHELARADHHIRLRKLPFGNPARPVSARFHGASRSGGETNGLRGLAAAHVAATHSMAQRSVPPTVFAEGVARPDADERLPLPRTASAIDDTTAHVSAALPARLPQPQVVQGFGSEVALPPSVASDRPGGTRRRNHPPTWMPESTGSLPVPLEEREAITAAAVSPTVLPELYDRNGRLTMPPPLRGSRDILLHQNLMAANDGLERIQDDADLDRLRAAHLLVGFPYAESLHVNEDLPANRRVARPWTALFAADLAAAFYARFHEPLSITSAARTVHYQARLQMVNGNAAATAGEAASPHLTGQAIDFGKRGMSQAELAWMRGYLLPLIQLGKIDVEEEFRQACFHISVYRSYAANRFPLHTVQQAHVSSPVDGVSGRSPAQP